MRIDVNLSQIGKLAQRFEQLGERAIPFAMRNTLNAVAFDARGEWVKRIKRTMTLRNRYTERSIRVQKVTRQVVDEMQSSVGSLLDYMEKQEQGGQESAKGKHGVPIPTSSAAGQAKKTRPRTKLVRPRNYLKAIQLVRGLRGSRKQRNAIAIRLARKNAGGVVFLNLGKRRGLFSVPSGPRAKPRMLYDLSHKVVRVRAHPTLEPTVRSVGPRILLHAERAIAYELQRVAAKGL